MRSRLALIASIVVMGVSLANAQIYTETGHVPQPWSGWWWPWYHDTVDTSRCCPHLWQGPNIDSGSSGPLYDLDTRYFWRSESVRALAQMWECDSHRVYDSTFDWLGHCNGVSCAQVLESDPPTDCGALSQDDLEGLLSEVYMNCWSDSLAGPGTKPSDMWLALRKCLGSTAPSPHALVVDFDTTITPQGDDSVVWDWPVFAYKIGCGLVNDTARGTMTLCYEGHRYNAQHDSCAATYGFWCAMEGLNPKRGTGGWSNCQGPGGNTSPPDEAFLPTGRATTIPGRNPYINYDTLKRVIDHKTIILDDAYMDSTYPCWPPSGLWERRPGYAESCWAARDTCLYEIWWHPRVLIDGLYRLGYYKTWKPAGETLDSNLPIWIDDVYWVFTNPEVPPYDTWHMFGQPLHLNQQIADRGICAGSFFPQPGYTYFDAIRFEYVGEGGDGGASSSAVALGDETQRVRVMPNPVGRTARISYSVAKPGRVDIVVYDVTGRSVLRAAQGIQRAGLQTATVSVAGLPTGTYMARISVNGVNTTCRFVVCR